MGDEILRPFETTRFAGALSGEPVVVDEPVAQHEYVLHADRPSCLGVAEWSKTLPASPEHFLHRINCQHVRAAKLS